MKKYLQETELLDFSNPVIQKIIAERGWIGLDSKEQVSKIYNFVRDEILFGYNKRDELKASEVLKDGYGQCNTKSILFMALLRAVGVPCRLHGFLVDKKMQKGAINGIWYKLAPAEIVHTWADVYYKDKWYELEGIILDLNYLKAVQRKNKECKGSFCGFGIATSNFENPKIEWNENSTYIQNEAIVDDLGLYDDPDSFYKKYRQNIGPLKRFVFRNIMRRAMNRSVRKVRNS